MGFLNFFRRSVPVLVRLPAGSFTVDRDGRVLVATLPSSFPADCVRDIAEQVLRAFAEAAAAQLPLAELVVQYPSLKITARELRGGAIVYLAPQSPFAPAA
jgi:hypothetical protein